MSAKQNCVHRSGTEGLHTPIPLPGSDSILAGFNAFLTKLGLFLGPVD